MINHLEMYNMIGDHQFRFRKRRSCLAQLLRFYNCVLKNIEEGSKCDGTNVCQNCWGTADKYTCWEPTAYKKWYAKEHGWVTGYIDMKKDEFLEICDKFRPSHIWEKKSNRWVLKKQLNK